MGGHSGIKCVVLTSHCPRHIYYANVMAEHFELLGVISEPKRDYFEKQQSGSELVRTHFQNLEKYERQYFGRYSDFPATDILRLEHDSINSEPICQSVRQKNPDVVLLYGTAILNNTWIEAFPDRIINLHLGLSPYYRGAATLFWPFVEEAPECVGATIHLATRKVDAGGILGRVKPGIEEGDTYYDITNKTIRKAIHELPATVQAYLKGDIHPCPQIFDSSSLLFRKDDFNEEVLQKVLDRYLTGLTRTQIQEIERSTRCPIN